MSAPTESPSPAVRRRSVGVVGLAVVGSRVFGLVRELVFAGMFGAGRNLDALLAAFQIPNLMRDLFAEGALSTAFTATFVQTAATRGDAQAWRLARLVFTAMLLIGSALCLAGMAAAPALVELTSFGFHAVPGKHELTVSLTRILFPFILFVSLAAAAMGMLNARGSFGLPASASTVFNIVSVVAGVAFAFALEPQHADWTRPAFTERALYGVAGGVLLGGLAQFAVQVPALWRRGFRYRWEIAWNDPGLRQVWALMWPSVLAGAVVQINVLVNGMFASEIDGARSWLNCAFRLMQFPIGVFGVAIATVTLPAVAALHARGDARAFGRTAAESLRLAALLTLPAAAGLFALAPEIIGLLYQRWNFTAEATAQTAAALRAYSVGLAAYAGIKVLVPCFAALHLPRTPLRVSLVGVGVNLGMNFCLVKWLRMGHVGLAATTSAVALLSCLQLALALRRRVPLGGAAEWTRALGSAALAALACAAAARWAADAAAGAAGPGPWARPAAVAAGVFAGCAAAGLAALALRVPEAGAAWRLLRGGRRRSRA